MRTRTDAELLEAAARLAAAAGRAPPVSLSALAGGKNNRVFHVALADGGSLILKSYFHDPRDTRDRLGAEWAFLTRARERGVGAAPEPLARDAADHLALYSFLPGEKLRADAVSEVHVRAAAAFVAAVNAPPRDLASAPPGSEACFSLAQHLATVERRVRRLDGIASDAPHADRARSLVADRLRPAWETVRSRIEEAARDSGSALDAPFPDEELIVSPSDFGFHNALWDETRGLGFLDFEYAGRDDPAKLAGDFFSCPEIPAPVALFDVFVDELTGRLALPRAVVTRSRLLLDAYRVKWTCIILNDFLPMDDARRAFAEQDEREARCARQLAKAEAKLAELGR